MPTHAEQRVLPYSPRQMFDLVADVERYPAFLPWCMACVITKRTAPLLTAALTVGVGPLRETFTSQVQLDETALVIVVKYLDGPFKYLHNQWRFLPHQQGCIVDFAIDFEFRSGLLQKTMTLFFNEAVRRMIKAFEDRAAAVYGG